MNEVERGIDRVLKTGIYRLEDLDTAKLRRGLLGRKNIYIGLYEELQTSSREDVDELQELLLLRYATGTGTLKRTYRRRFVEFDQLAIEVIRERFGQNNVCRIHDVGVSDGRTSFDFFNELASSQMQKVEFLASDFSPYATVLSEKNSRLTLVLDHQDKLTQVIWPPFVFNVPTPENPFYFPLNAFILRVLLRKSVMRLLSRYERGERSLIRRRITLLCRSFREVVKNNQNVEFVQYDVLKPMKRNFDVVRAMNVLNPGYFSNVELLLAIRNIRDTLTEGGLLVTGRNENANSPVEGGIYEKRGDGFIEVRSLSMRTPIHDLIISKD